MTRSSPTRTRSIRALARSTIVAAGFAAAVPMSAQAQEEMPITTSVPCSTEALISAIDTANDVLAPTTLALSSLCTYELTSVSDATNGPTGLPIIIRDITLSGDQNRIVRSLAGGTPTFRIAQVAGGGKLTLKNTTLENGVATGSGGGILNFGAVTLTGSGLTNNTASGTGGGLSNADIDIPAPGAEATFTSSTVIGNIASGRGGGIYNGLRGTLTTTSTEINNNSSTNQQGGGIAAVNSMATTMTTTPITANSANSSLFGGAGGVLRISGTMTSTDSPVTANAPNNCTGSSPSVPGCLEGPAAGSRAVSRSRQLSRRYARRAANAKSSSLNRRSRSAKPASRSQAR